MILNKEILDDLRMKEIEQFNIQSSIMGVILNHQICFQCFYLLLFMGGSVNYQSNSPQHIHQRLGNVQLIKKPSTINPTGAITTIKKIIPVRNDKEFQVWQQSLNRVKNTETLDVIFFPDNYHFEGAGMCGSTGVITLLFPDYFFVLESEIRNRENHNKPFLETEIWYLLYNMIRAAKQYQKFNEKVGDIRPANIVINEDGQIKIISVHTCPGELTNYQKAIESRTENVYLAPEECRDQYIKTAQYPGNVSKTAAEIFSIGVTLLQSIILKDGNALYNRAPYAFNTQAYQRYKFDLKNSYYSQHLKHLVMKMIDFNPEARPKASQVYQKLYPFENDILDLQQFRFPSYYPAQTTQTQIIHPVTMQQPLSPRFVQPQLVNSMIPQRAQSPQFKTVIHKEFSESIIRSPVQHPTFQHRRI